MHSKHFPEVNDKVLTHVSSLLQCTPFGAKSDSFDMDRFGSAGSAACAPPLSPSMLPLPLLRVKTKSSSVYTPQFRPIIHMAVGILLTAANKTQMCLQHVLCLVT